MIVVTHNTVLDRKKTSTEIRSLFPDEVPILPIEMTENTNNNAEFLLCIWTYDGNSKPRTREYVMPGKAAWVLTTQSKVNPEQWKMIEQEYQLLANDLKTENQTKSAELSMPKS